MLTHLNNAFLLLSSPPLKKTKPSQGLCLAHDCEKGRGLVPQGPERKGLSGALRLPGVSRHRRLHGRRALQPGKDRGRVGEGVRGPAQGAGRGDGGAAGGAAVLGGRRGEELRPRGRRRLASVVPADCGPGRAAERRRRGPRARAGPRAEGRRRDEAEADGELQARDDGARAEEEERRRRGRPRRRRVSGAVVAFRLPSPPALLLLLPPARRSLPLRPTASSR